MPTFFFAVLVQKWHTPGADPGFQVRGVHLKKVREARIWYTTPECIDKRSKNLLDWKVHITLKPKHTIYVRYFSILLYLLNVQVAPTENKTSLDRRPPSWNRITDSTHAPPVGNGIGDPHKIIQFTFLIFIYIYISRFFFNYYIIIVSTMPTFFFAVNDVWILTVFSLPQS
jgi:hypothetical protein